MYIYHFRNLSVSPMCQLLLALRYFATGHYGLSLADYAGVSQPTASRIVHRVSRAIACLRQKYIIFPESDAQMREAMVENFSVAGFPKVLGMMDCTHIKIKSPGELFT